ncbi:hypothetical protein D3C78_1485820 [compost metagenome]
MRDVFRWNTGFNGDVSGWNTAAVTTMSGMFDGASAFNRDISSWNTGNTTNIGYMFRGASAFNQNLSQWCLNKVTISTSYDLNATSWAPGNKPTPGLCPTP